ncbi:MAG TPA: SAM-dependent chlorinase/fluorinase [Thermomicrobiales bacterium]|nr:SAM-dependent chlorinase/fluorinase [Thermomicrobiales bacterium]
MQHRPNGIVTLMTDFGTVDGYVAAMKGSLLTANPSAVMVDVTHHIPTHDITEAAFQLATVWYSFPNGTTHLIVVDPGVGGERRAVGVKAAQQYFIAPDNGILTLVISNVAPDAAVVLDRADLFRSDVSSTFHGRDIFAPVAGYLSSGRVPFSELGSVISPDSLVRLPWAPVRDAETRIHAPVVSIDRFGNCRTLITQGQLPAPRDTVYVRCGDVTIRGIHRTYSDVPVGKTLALFGSHGGLEISVRGGNAAHSWEISRGVEVEVFAADDTASR